MEKPDAQAEVTDRLDLVLEALAGGEALIVTHNNPDPDGVAAMLGLSRLLRDRFEREGTIAYAGNLGRAENRAMVSALQIPLIPFLGIDPDRFDRIALVDAQPEFQNHPLGDRPPDVVLDHHPAPEACTIPCARIVDPSYGSTSGLVAELLDAAGVEIDPILAAALYYGIKTDTQDLTRSARDSEGRWMSRFHAACDRERLRKILFPPLRRSYYAAFRDAIESARIYADRLIVVPLKDPIAYPDLVADFADFFVRLDGVGVSLVFGLYGDEVHISARTEERAGDAGAFARDCVEGRGPSGGHGLFAGGQIPLSGRDPEPVFRRLLEVASSLVGKSSEAFRPLV